MPEKTCFVISPIGDAGSETRKRSDLVLNYIIKPAARECGYKAERADELSDPGMITSQVIQRIIDDQLVIADLTDHNPNVFYELAIRHAIRRPLVQIIRKDQKIPFDVAGARTIPFETDLESAEETKGAIKAQIQSLEADPSKLETPISATLDLQTLRQSGNAEQRSLADVLSMLGEIRSSISGFDKRFESFESSDRVKELELHLRAAMVEVDRTRQRSSTLESQNAHLMFRSAHSAMVVVDPNTGRMLLEVRNGSQLAEFQKMGFEIVRELVDPVKAAPDNKIFVLGRVETMAQITNPTTYR